MLENLDKYRVLLASKSPRRKELLSQLRIPFTVITLGGIDESYPADMRAEDVSLFLARKKGKAFRSVVKDRELVITADTVVICDGRIYGKPHTRQEACDMLHALSGRTHKVVTGVCIMTAAREAAFSTETLVSFADIAQNDIDYYVDNFQPYDKAGAYGIQEWIGCVAIKSIEGSFYNVMGLPVHRLYSELRNF